MKEIQPYTFSSATFKRFRHLRTDAAIRDFHAEVKLSANDFVLPFFIVEGSGVKKEISSLQGVYHLSPDVLLEELREPVKLGINKILLFGVINETRKDEVGSFSASAENPVNIAMRLVKENYPNLTVITDVCLCAYTSHGHCGILNGEVIDNDQSLTPLAQMALSNAIAGADIVAPSAMMDGQVWAIRQLLDLNGFSKVKILAYSAKYSSNLYGPFRGAANSKPSFGDRKTYQMDYRSASQAIEEMAADLNEGADFLMVKPAHTYLDIILRGKTEFPGIPMVAYHVSGEYMMVKAAAAAGILNEEAAALEIHTAIKRAGADWIISYYAPLLAEIINHKAFARCNASLIQYVMNNTLSSQAYNNALKVMPGGVNSPVRSFKSIGIPPVFIKKASGSTLEDIDGNKYVDFCLSWGVGILGHAPPQVVKAAHAAIENGSSYGAPTLMETELASLLVQSTPSMEKVRLVSSGTEAVMSAIRLARAYTKRDIIVKFDGCYHGHSDMLLVNAGSGLAEQTSASSQGVPVQVVNHTVSIPFNDIEALNDAFERYGNNIAAVILEPIPANMGVVLPQEGFLEYIRQITHQHGSLLIFDEVITGFRFCFGGVQKLLGIEPDITTFGKIIGGGFPVGAYGASAEIMSMIAPDGPVYQAGTLSGNPVAVSAGIATLELLCDEKIYVEIEQKSSEFFEKLQAVASKNSLQLNVFKNMFTLYFSGEKVNNFSSALKANHSAFANFYIELLNEGIYLSPSGYEANFISAAHTGEELERTVERIDYYTK